jgi:hypothetical protein
MRATLLMVMAAALITTAAGCSKRPAGAGHASPAFEQRWTTLAQRGTEAIYIEDDGGEGLMGNVLRSQPSAAALAPIKANESKGAPLPEQPDQQRVQQIVRQYLPGVKSCYLRMSRAGSPPSGKAIVSFGIAGSGQVQELKVDAPAFEGTPLSGCISGQVAHWVFPASRNGMDGMSYPFVFVGT